MFAIWYEFRGLDSLIRDFELTEQKLRAGFEEPLRRTRDALRLEIRNLFASQGQSNSRGPAQIPWKQWTAMTIQMRIEQKGYYGTRPGTGGTIGDWSGEMLNSFLTDTPPGFSNVSANDLVMGIDPFSADTKWVEFLQGRGSNPPQPSRAVFENINAEEVALDVFANWLRDEVPLFTKSSVTVWHGESPEFVPLSDGLWWTSVESIAEAFAGQGGTVYSAEISAEEAAKYKTAGDTEYYIPAEVTKGRTKSRTRPGEPSENDLFELH